MCIQGFLGKHTATFDQTPEAFRRVCLAELEKARKSKQLSIEGLTAEEAVKQAAAFPYYSDPEAVMDVGGRVDPENWTTRYAAGVARERGNDGR